MMQTKRDDDAGQLMEFVKRYGLSLNSLLRSNRSLTAHIIIFYNISKSRGTAVVYMLTI